MTTNDTTFAGSIPALYDRHLGPLLFEPYAPDLVRRSPASARRDSGNRVRHGHCHAALPNALRRSGPYRRH